MKFSIETPRPTRQVMPVTVFGKEWTEKLYARYHALANKARKRATPFTWNSFQEFLIDLEKVAPEDYHPGTHRFSFSLDKKSAEGAELGYCPETLSILLTKTKDAPKKLSEADKSVFMGELTRIMLGGYCGTLDELIDLAKTQANIK